MSLLGHLALGIWPWEWPEDIATALREALGMVGALIIGFFIFLFGLGVVLGKIPVPGAKMGRWIVFFIAFALGAGVIYFTVMV